MPLELRELVIKVSVSETAKKDHIANDEQKLRELKKQLLGECVAILEEKFDRYYQR